MKKIIILFLVVNFSFGVNKNICQWMQTNGPSSPNINSLIYSQGNVFASTPIGVFRTTNNGDNWIGAGFSGLNSGLLTAVNNYLFVASNGGIYRSSNLGVNWTLTNYTYNNSESITSSGNTLFLGTYDKGIYRTTDYGETWDTVNSGITSHDITALGSYNGVVYCGTWNDWWVYKSTNNGDNWINIGLEGHILGFAFDGNKMMVGRCDSIFATSNNGANWYYAGSGLSMGCENTQLYQAGTNIFVSSCGKLHMTTNFGTNWIIKNQGLENQDIKSFVATSDKVFAGTYAASVWKRDLSEIIEVKNISSNVPDRFSLFQNYPNPFNPKTIIKFQIKDSRFVTLKVYDILGREIETLVNEKMNAGTYEVPFSINQFSNNQLSSGVYFYKLVAGDYTETKKMLLIK